MRKTISYIGQYIEDDGRDIHDRTYNRKPQDFILRLRSQEYDSRFVSSTPKMNDDVILAIREAIKAKQTTPYRVISKGVQVQIYDIIE